MEIAGAPAGDIEIFVVDREIDIGNERRAGLETFERWRQQVGIGRLGRDLNDLPGFPDIAFAIPGPDRRRQIFQAQHAVDKTIGLGRVVRRPQLENQLMLGAEIDLLQVLAAVEIPEMQLVAVLPSEQQLGHEAVLEHIRRAPLAGHHGVVSEMPPHVIGEFLWSAINLPSTEQIKSLMIHQQDAAGGLSFGVTERADIDPVRSAMDSVRTGVPRAIGDLGRLDELDDFWVLGVGLRIEDINARRTKAGHDQIPAFDVRMRHIRAQARAARIPTEMMQLITGSGHLDATNDLPVGQRPIVEIHNGHLVVTPACGIEARHVGQLLRWRACRQTRGGVESRIGCPGSHTDLQCCPLARSPRHAAFPRARACTSAVVRALPPIPQSPLSTSSTRQSVTLRMFSPSIETIASVSLLMIWCFCSLLNTSLMTRTWMRGIGLSPVCPVGAAAR